MITYDIAIACTNRLFLDPFKTVRGCFQHRYHTKNLTQTVSITSIQLCVSFFPLSFSPDISINQIRGVVAIGSSEHATPSHSQRTVICGDISHLSPKPSLHAFRNKLRLCGHGQVVVAEKDNLSFVLLLADLSIYCTLDRGVTSDTLPRFPVENDIVTFCRLLTDYRDFSGAPHAEVLLEEIHC